MTIRIFLADDHAIVRDGVGMILNHQTDMHVVGTTGNGREAVRLAARLHPDIAVMGIAMPGLNGIDATRQIRQERPSTRVVMLSMHSSPRLVFRAMRAGASGFVMKESGGQELVSAIRIVHHGGRHLSEPIAEQLIDDYVSQKGFFETGDPLSKLSGRERAVLTLVVEGRTVREIGEMLRLSAKTVHTHRYHIMEKLSITDMPGLVRFGMANGLIPLYDPGQAAGKYGRIQHPA